MFKDRLEIWQVAKEEVASIVEQNGLDPMIKGGSSNLFGVSPAKTYSKVDQHIDAIIKVADWLLEEDKD